MIKITYTKGQFIKNCEFIKELPMVNGKRCAEFKCFCGEIFTTIIANLKNGKKYSCGCAYLKSRSTCNLIHGHSRRRHQETPEYRSWMSMKNRCTNPNNDAYNDYGGRGINVCGRWLHSFISFFEDMGERPSIKHSLERRDNDLGYSKDNCYWATKKEQANNKRSSLFIDYKGKIQTLKQWAE